MPITVSFFKISQHHIQSAGGYLVDLATKDQVTAVCEALPEKKQRTWTNLLRIVYGRGRCSPHRWSPWSLWKPSGGPRDCKSWVWREQRFFSLHWLAEVFSPPYLELSFYLTGKPELVLREQQPLQNLWDRGQDNSALPNLWLWRQ